MEISLIMEFRKATGWTESKILKELEKVSCNYRDALKVYLAAGRLPDEEECLIIQMAGFDAWLSVWSKNMKLENDIGQWAGVIRNFSLN